MRILNLAKASTTAAWTGILLSSLLTRAPSAAASTLVYMAFVPDEVGHVAEGLIKEQPGAQIYAITSDYDGATLFGRPAANLLKGRPGYATVDQKDLKPGTPAADLAMSLKSQGLNGLGIQVLEVSSAKTPAQDAIVIIKAPLHGKYPETFSSFFENSLKALQSLPQASDKNGGIVYASLGSAGGIREDRAPGTTRAVGASVFLGSESVFKGEDKPFKYRAVIRGAGPEGVTEFFKGQEFATRAEAEQDVEARFDSAPPVSLKQWVQERLEKGSEASLTTSFFAGNNTKKIGASVGLTQVNMEDYHVLSVLSSNRDKVKEINIERMVADPASIPQELADRVQHWARTARFTEKHYLDAIQWGLEGTDLARLPATGRWDVFKALKPSQVAPYFPPVGGSSSMTHLNPFFVELSQRFLNHLASGYAFKDPASVLPRTILDGLSKNARDELQELLNEKTKRLQESADEVFRSFAGKAPDFREKARSLLLQTRALDLPAEGALANELKTSSIPLLGAGDGNFEIWVAPDRWERGNQFRLSRIGGDAGLTDSQIDRASYRMALSALLPERGKNFARRISERWRNFNLTRNLKQMKAPASVQIQPCP